MARPQGRRRHAERPEQLDPGQRQVLPGAPPLLVPDAGVEVARWPPNRVNPSAATLGLSPVAPAAAPRAGAPERPRACSTSRSSSLLGVGLAWPWCCGPTTVLGYRWDLVGDRHLPGPHRPGTTGACLPPTSCCTGFFTTLRLARLVAGPRHPPRPAPSPPCACPAAPVAALARPHLRRAGAKRAARRAHLRLLLLRLQPGHAGHRASAAHSAAAPALGAAPRSP